MLDPQGNLWIAIFTSKHDEVNVGAWEKVVHDLARLCGLNVPESKLEHFSKNGSTFLVKRFDRVGSRRIHFSSAMTMLGKTDGAGAKDGTGYLDMVSFIKSNGASPKEDLIELWKRVVFNMAVSNTDDHLRNHGFLLVSNGWRLSPLYDVNPVEEGIAELDALRRTEAIDKLTFGSSALVDVLKAEKDIESITFVGLCTDICVISNAMVVKAFFPEVPLIVDAKGCAGVSPESHQRALEAMKVCQIKIIND